MSINCNDEVIIKILGKVSMDIDAFQDLKEQRKLRSILEEVLYNYDVSTKCTDLAIGSDIDEKLNMFIACKKLDGMSPKTLKNYVSEISMFQTFINKPTYNVTTNDVRMYLAIKCKDLKETSKNTKITILRSFFSWLLEEEYIDKNPMLKIKTPKIPKRLREGLSAEESEILRESCKSDRERAMLEFFLSTGCRLSEVASLNIFDLDFHNLTFRVIGKGNKERIGYFTPKAKLLIQKYLQTRKGTSEALFTSSKAPYGRLCSRALEKEIENIKTRSGINKDIFPHLLIVKTYTEAKLNIEHAIEELETLARCNCIFL